MVLVTPVGQEQCFSIGVKIYVCCQRFKIDNLFQRKLE